MTFAPHDPEFINRLMYDTFGGLKHMTRKDYEALVTAIREMSDAIRIALSADGGATTEQITEIITARIALVLAKDNAGFDSFKFAAAVKGRKT